MSRAKDAPVRWMPATELDREMVQQELHAILSSLHFRNSKRYPSLLRYVVEKTLNGESETLKERTLGVEVFDRRPDYDTNADPVVRSSASEIRRRLAQYYHETGEDSAIQIELPLGSYVPDFRFERAPAETTDAASHWERDLQEDAVEAIAATAGEPASGQPAAKVESAPRAGHPWRLLSLVLLAAALVAGGFYYFRFGRVSAIRQLWAPLLQSPGPVLFVVGSGSLELTSPESPETTLFNHMIGPYHHISVASAVAISRLASTLEVQNKHYFVKEAASTSLIDVRERSVVVVEALNNTWALRLVEPLRFRFGAGPMARIEDRQNPLNNDWTVDFSQPFHGVSRDYGIVARYRDPLTNGNVMIVAGLGPYGTQAASDLVTSPTSLEQVTRQLPAGWQKKNIELVLRTDVIDGEAGPPQLIAQTVW